MTTTIKITELTDIGANLASSTVLPVVNMSGTPTTQKTVLGNIANVILEGAGTDYSPVGEATLAGTVTTNAQPNITSTGSLTGLTVSNSSGVVNFSNTANVTLGAIGNLHISGGTAGQLLSTNGNGTLSWASDTTTYGNSNVAAYLPTYTGNVGANWVIASYFMGNAHNLTYLPGANVNGAVPYATTANSVAAANVSGLGNIATVNLTGSSSNVLYGNGVFAPVTGGSIQSKIANGTSNVTITPSNGPVVINVNGTEAWTFSDSGNLQTAGDIVGPAGANLVIYANAGVHEFTFGDDGTFYAPDNVVLSGTRISMGPGAANLASLTNAVFIASTTGDAYIQAVIENVSDNGSADWVALGHRGNDNGGWADMGFTSSGFNDANYTITGQGDGYVFVQSFYDGQVLGSTRGGNLVLATGNNGTVNDIIFGTGGFATSDIFGRISDSNNALELSRTGSSIKFYDGTELGVIEGANTFGLYNANATEFLLESGATAWSFNGTNGTTGFPTLTVDLHNGGNQTAQTLQFGDPSKQAVITGPTPAVDTAAQRLIIQGQRGSGLGEGGDVYVWGGDSDVNGGDIKIYAGDADVSGSGGYVNIDGGSGVDGGGQITVTGGYSANGPGGTVYVTAGNGADAGDLNLAGGQSSTAGNDGGNANLAGGYGQNNGGAVTITGGQSALGLANYGNVRVESGASAWTFDNTGLLTFPGTPRIYTDANNFEVQAAEAINFEANTVVNIYTDTSNNGWQWQFGDDGILNLAGGNSTIQSIANSSLDPTNPNVSTMTLTPDANYNSQVLVLDPTAPGHIHLRAYAFSNIDDPAANIFLGGEDTAFEITSGANNEARIHSGNNTWTFGSDGNLNFPRDAVGNTDPYLVINGGSGPAINSVDVSLAGPANLLISSDYLNLTGFTGAKVAIKADNGEIATDANMVLTTNGANVGNTYSWTFDNGGNLTLPGNTFAVNYANGAQVSLGSSYGDSNVVSLLSSFGSNTITTTGNVSVGNIAGSTNGYTLGYLNIPQVAASNTTLALGDAGKHYYSTTAGNFTLTVPNNSSAAFATGTAISIVVQAAGNILVNAASGVTLYMAGNSTAANRVVGGYGMATLMKVASDTWFINGTGVS